MHRHCFVNTVDIGKRKELCIQLELYARQKSFRHICKIVPKKTYPFKSCFMKALKKSIIYPRLGPLISSGFIQRFTSPQPLGHGGVIVGWGATKNWTNAQGTPFQIQFIFAHLKFDVRQIKKGECSSRLPKSHWHQMDFRYDGKHVRHCEELMWRYWQENSRTPAFEGQICYYSRIIRNIADLLIKHFLGASF